ncbi:portal protein [Rhizobium favelukesii]|uniref:Conserved protein n=1 Tax=Rhizobium favelukesii TaxID=348824 RepID=W6RAK5_9HYPH|nr:hypothetical protein [Rhizobium favelukesii]MCS0459314.1 hypothetical protein [Rhizobium favelukesii]CDM57385.1 putative conserved protein [Rhizobium favelukesii]
MAKKTQRNLAPEVSRRKQGEALTDIQKSSIVALLVRDSEDFIDSMIAPEREQATRYFNGEPLGNEEDGRSQIIMTEVRDVVLAMMPSLLRVFLSTENVVEYAPRRADAVEQAEQSTDYVNYIFYNENDGAQVLYSLFEDGLVRKTGIAKWYVNKIETVSEESYEHLDEEQLAFLENEDGMELIELDQLLQEGFDEVDPQTGEPIMQPATYNAKFKRTAVDKKFVVEALPPEEFLIARNARCEDTAELIGQRKDMLVSDLVAMGYELDEVLLNGDPQPLMDLNQESQARNPALQQRNNLDYTKLDPSMMTVRYYELLVRMDADGDGIAELHKICSIGQDGSYILDDEIVSDVNFAIFCPSPIPHTAIGNSIADQVMDIQRIKTNIVRNTLDSLSQTIHPRLGVVEGQVNLDDAMNTEMGGIIRMRNPGAVVPLAQPFVGQQSLPILAYLDDTRAQRTGISRATQGLDADVLQSTTKAAVTATVSAAEARLEMVARLFADGGMKRMFRGILKMVTQNQDKPRTVRLRGKWVDVNPTGWDADMDVVTNVGLGMGDKNDKIAVLMATAMQQKEILTTLGPTNPLVDLIQFRATLAKILELNGFKDTETYYKAVTPEALQQMQQSMQQNQKPDPAQILAQVEQQKTMADIAINRAKLSLQERDMKLEDDRQRDQMEVDAYLRAFEIQAKYGAQVDMAGIQARMDRQRLLVETAITVADNNANAQETEAPTAPPAGGPM